MLSEAIEYFYNSIFCPSYIKELGLLHEIVAIKARHARCKDGWQTHLEKSRELILERAQGKKKILVFGAGLLYDFPLDELEKLGCEITLVDIFFLQSSLAEIKRSDNVHFIQHDVTELLEEVYKFSLKPLKLVARLKNLQFKIPESFIDDGYDLVISLNLASQLALPLKNYFEKLPIKDENLSSVLEPFYKSIAFNHFKYLEKFKKQGADVLALCDYEKRVFDKAGDLKAREESLDLSKTNENFKQIASWDWQVAPYGELEKEYRLELQVVALHPTP